MAEFTTYMQSFKPSFPFLDAVDQYPNMELFNHFPEMNSPSHAAENHSTLNFHNNNSCCIGFSNDLTPEFPGNLAENFPGIFQTDDTNHVMMGSQPPIVVSNGNNFHQSMKRKSEDTSETISWNSFSPLSGNGITRKNKRSVRAKKVKGNEKEEIEEENPKEVVHVRARRGQATDSHSLAERVRRGKINERLRCLKDIVPGCYKTMGMALMLDEIINYVQSLQNQVEFLSMKLTAASTFHDFNSETDAMQTLQRSKTYEAQKLHRTVSEGNEGLASTQLGPFDLTFGCYPSIPYNT